MIVCKSNITVDKLSHVELVRPRNAGAVWNGIKHIDLVEAMMDEMHSRGWKVETQAFSLSNDRADLAGAFDLTLPDVDAPEGQRLSLGFLTSNAMRRSLKLVVGTRVFVCNNGMATGEIVMRKKHTIKLDLHDELAGALDTYVEKARQIPRLVEKLHARNLVAHEVDAILMDAGRQGVMPWSRIGQVDKEYSRPTYADHNERTSFGLLQAFTHVVKKCPPLSQMDQINQFRQLLPVAA